MQIDNKDVTLDMVESTNVPSTAPVYFFEDGQLVEWNETDGFVRIYFIAFIRLSYFILFFIIDTSNNWYKTQK